MREEIRSARSLGLVISAATYLVALVVAVLVVRAAGLAHPLADLGLGTLVATVVVFAVSMAVDNSSIYDPYWSLQPLAIAGYYLWTGWSEADARQIVVTCLVFLYALRLTSNFYRDWPGLGKEDFRYVSFRERFGRGYWPVSFLGIHLFPTVMVYLGCLPLYALTRSGAAGSVGWTDLASWLRWAPSCWPSWPTSNCARSGAIRRIAAGSSAADLGRAAGTRTTWGRSRPGGGCGCSPWPPGSEWWWTVVGAAAITAMFVFVSIPMMERRVLATRPDYAEYREQTPMLVPRPWPIRGDPPAA